MVKKLKTFESKLKFHCPHCLATYTLFEIHLTNKELTKCLVNCTNAWQEQLFKYCQEKVLRQELAQEQSEEKSGNLIDFFTNKHK